MVKGELNVIRERVPADGAEMAFMGAHSRSFRFAARFFPAAGARRVAGVYAFCRITDDLVDRPAPGCDPRAVLDAWERLARAAHERGGSGIPLLDRVMGDAAASGVPFACPAGLIEGMRMDLRAERYGSLEELRGYTHRVASVVGEWITRLAGVHHPAVLARAGQMGHAMQLTNIARDVGEDWRRGRLYLPRDLLDQHGVPEAEIARMAAGAPISDGYRAATEALLRIAEAEYAAALPWVACLPPAYRRAASVAAHVYRAIHGRIRANGYDNLTRRAHTGTVTRWRAAAAGLLAVRRAGLPVLDAAPVRP